MGEGIGSHTGFIFSPFFFWALVILGACSYRVNKGGDATASFSSLNDNIFSTTCISCHSSTNTNGGFDVSSFDSITTSKDVVAGDPAKSKLYTKVALGSMPLGGPMLSDTNIDAIKMWIQNGAKND